MGGLFGGEGRRAMTSLEESLHAQGRRVLRSLRSPALVQVFLDFVGPRYREPVYRSLRELAMSYFEAFYNLAGEKTLRTSTRPIRLARFDRLNWEAEDEGLDVIARHTDRVPRIRLITPAMARGLSRLDGRSRRAGLQGVNPAGLYRGPMKRRGDRSEGDR